MVGDAICQFTAQETEAQERITAVLYSKSHRVFESTSEFTAPLATLLGLWIMRRGCR
jgi:hypothetical protein